MNDDELEAQIQKKSEAALSELIDKYTPLLSTVINNLTKGLMMPWDIEECLADSFYTLWNNAEKIQKGRMKGYLLTIAKSKAWDMLRKRRKTSELQELNQEEMTESFSMTDYIDNCQLREDIVICLSKFDTLNREILIRYFYYYQTSPEIAAVTGLSAEAVKSRIRRSVPKLRALLKEKGYQI